MSARTIVLSGILAIGLLGDVRADDKTLPGLTISPMKDPTVLRFVLENDADKEPVTGYIGLPKGIGPFRTVIISHNPGGNALQVTINYGKRFLDRGYAFITAELKYAPKPEESDWTEMFRRLGACVEILRNDSRFDPSKIYAFGNGAGAMASLAFAAQTDKLTAVGGTGGGKLPKEGINFEKISAPVILVHGAKDESVPLEAAMQVKSNLEKAGKSVETRIFENSGHEVVMLKAGDVFDTIVAFFNSKS